MSICFSLYHMVWSWTDIEGLSPSALSVGGRQQCFYFWTGGEHYRGILQWMCISQGKTWLKVAGRQWHGWHNPISSLTASVWGNHVEVGECVSWGIHWWGQLFELEFSHTWQAKRKNKSRSPDGPTLYNLGWKVKQEMFGWRHFGDVNGRVYTGKK